MCWQTRTGFKPVCSTDTSYSRVVEWTFASELDDSRNGGGSWCSGAGRCGHSRSNKTLCSDGRKFKMFRFFCCRFSESIGSFVKRTRSTFLCIIGKGGNDRVINSPQSEVSPSPAAHNKRKHGAHSFSKAQVVQCLAR